MIEISENLFVGSLDNYENHQHEEAFYFVQACKEPCHRKALGYTGRSCDASDPEYLVAYRDRRIILNMVDAPIGKYFDLGMFDQSLAFIEEHLTNGKKILIHCNLGISRSPSIGLLYLAAQGKIRNSSFKEAQEDFVKIYPDYAPSGIKEFLTSNWGYFFPELNELP